MQIHVIVAIGDFFDDVHVTGAYTSLIVATQALLMAKAEHERKPRRKRENREFKLFTVEVQ